MKTGNKAVLKGIKCTCKIAVLVLFLIFINTKFFQKNQLEFSGEDLPSILVDSSAYKTVTDLHRAGYLTFGPYIALKAGNYQIEIEYATDTDNNSVDVFSGNRQKTYYQSQLESDSAEKKFRLVLDEPVTDLEIRTFYIGEGTFTVEKIIIREDIRFGQIVINILLLVAVLSYKIFKKKSAYEFRYLLCVFAILCMPVIFTIINNIFGIKADVELKGNFEETDMPRFDAKKFILGDFQNEFEAWWNENFVSRGFMITSYNQIRYSCFDLGNRIIGNEKSIFEEAYINDFFCSTDAYDYSLKANQDAMHDYAEHLQSLAKKLEKLGKKFLVYTTVSKVDEDSDSIPYKYFLKYKNDTKVRAIDYFRGIVGDYDFPYVDSGEVLNNLEKKYPVFYKTGIHWSRPAEQEVSLAILEKLRSVGVAVGEFQLTSLEQSSTPFWRDADIYDLLNIFFGAMDSAYYQYDTEIISEGTANILLQGGSFGLGFLRDIVENRAGGKTINIFYDDYIEEWDGNKIPITSWSEVDLKKYIEIADVIIVEANEHVLNTYNRGFVEYLDGYLDSYINGDNYSDLKGGTNVDFSKEDDYSDNLIFGFYWIEEGYRWTESKAKIKLKNENIIERGIEIDINIPPMLSDYGNVEISVNGVCKTVPLSNKGQQSIVFLPEELENSGIYEIMITTTDTFIPKELGINEDDRVLGVQVYYVGEKR